MADTSEPDDIVTRLREEGFITHIGGLPRESKILHAAADEIERLRELFGNTERLRAERDEARRRLCLEWMEHGPVRLSKEHIAMRYGWDCFKETR
jgi:hypothetical protein